LIALAGVVTGYALLAAAALWARTECLPVSSDEFKWQCAATVWMVAAAYFFVFFLVVRKSGLLAAASVFLLVFPGHQYLPQLGLVSFGKSWYLNPEAWLFALLPALAGAALGARLRARRARTGG